MPLVDVEYVNFGNFNAFDEQHCKNNVNSLVWQRYIETKELTPELADSYLMVLSAIVDLSNNGRKSKPSQEDIFLNDAEFINSGTYRSLEIRQEKYKNGLHKYDNGKVY